MTDQEIVTELQSKSKVYAPTDLEGSTDIKYNVFYDLGGYNYFNGQRNRRGYYLSVTPVTRVQEGAYNTESFGLFKGAKYRVFFNEDCMMYGVEQFIEEYCGRRNYWEQVLPPEGKGARHGKSAYTMYKRVAQRWIEQLTS